MTHCQQLPLHTRAQAAQPGQAVGGDLGQQPQQSQPAVTALHCGSNNAIWAITV